MKPWRSSANSGCGSCHRMVTCHHLVTHWRGHGTEIGPLAVRRSIWIDASPSRVWEEFEDLERMRRWFGTGHTLVRYEPTVGAEVETDAGATRR